MARSGSRKPVFAVLAWAALTSTGVHAEDRPCAADGQVGSTFAYAIRPLPGSTPEQRDADLHRFVATYTGLRTANLALEGGATVTVGPFVLNQLHARVAKGTRIIAKKGRRLTVDVGGVRAAGTDDARKLELEIAVDGKVRFTRGYPLGEVARAHGVSLNDSEVGPGTFGDAATAREVTVTARVGASKAVLAMGGPDWGKALEKGGELIDAMDADWRSGACRAFPAGP